jgi:secreted trypsin-like serine protease
MLGSFRRHRSKAAVLTAVILFSLSVTDDGRAQDKPKIDGAPQAIKSFGRRIVGGEPTTIKEHPWQVALNVTLDGEIFVCGGSLVADRWVLTAAHCFRPTTKPNEVRVKSGATDLVAEGQWSSIERIVIHEANNHKTHENDLALVRLSFPPEGRIIPMMKVAQPLTVGQPFEVAGWGATSYGGYAARRLLKATVPYVANETCNEPTAYNGAIMPSMMCAGYQEGGVDSCQGDSGGPLVWYTADGPVLVGVVSWGDGCARKLRYGVYTRVVTYTDWIAKVVARNGS